MTVDEVAETAAARPIARPPGLHWGRQIPRIFGTVMWIVAIISFVSAIARIFRSDIQAVRETIDAAIIPAPANVAYAVFLAVLATATLRRKRVAWWLLTVYFGLSVLINTIIGIIVSFVPDAELVDDAGNHLYQGTGDLALLWSGLGVSVVALALLILFRGEFYAHVAKGSVRRALAVFVGTLAVGVGLGLSLVAAFPGSLEGTANQAAYATERVLGGGFSFDITRIGAAPGWVSFVLGLFGAVAVFAAMATLLRSQRRNAELHAGDERQIRTLLAKYGDRDSLGYFATRRDKSAIFSPTGKSAVTYRVVNGVSLASGDPVGDPEAWGPAIDAWLAQARYYAWTPAVMGASEEGAIAYARTGLKVIHLGDEAILLTREYTLDGRDMRPVRQAVNRVERAGYTATVRRHSDIPEAEMKELAHLATAWRDTESERGFSMALGRLGDPADARCVLVEAVDKHNEVKAMISFSPWGTHGLSLDLMRRAPDAENGAMEFMVSELMEGAPRLGVDRVSLNFAVFRAVFEEGARIGAGPILRAWRKLLLFFSRWWQLESLYRSNAKYHPVWQPRFLCFGERRELVRVGLSSAIAEGFLALPGTSGDQLDTLPPDAAVRAREAEAIEAAEAPPGPGEVDHKAPEQMRVRLAKRERLIGSGIDPYPVNYPRTDTCAEVAAAHRELAPDTRSGDKVGVAGRVMLMRDHGGILFATIRDWSGDLQVMLTGRKSVDGWDDTIDIGDHVGVTGEVITTRTGELTVEATSWQLNAKCLRPLPDKHRGLADPEARVRQRYLDLVTNKRARDLLRARGNAIFALRESLVGRRFLEVETPILQRIHGGANAKPFTTHINAYDLKLYLRIAPELYLKRLAVGGVERVFELGRTFRNEGADYSHNPEFTVLEAYQAYGDYDTMLRLTRELIQEAAIAAYGQAVARRPGTDEEVDISGDWPVRTVNEAVSTALGEVVDADTDVATLRRYCDKAEIAYDPKWGRGAVLLELYEHLVESKTDLPTFYKDFPTEVSPLTRQNRHDGRLAERWDLVGFGFELGTAYSELIDPVEQRRRLTEQSLLAAGGDPEAMELDEDFLQALEYAMPPTGGLGIGVDRLVMLLTGRSIRETLPFPLVRAAS
ncbi:bifunctional lysylphosphatidylglycerol synthetase/lysine--tRNA ligase LysX [Asanoa iriomotensis]|uniref:Lysine--tRNA ligase n=1 Tax=Asanoa iriomotensis TaxID=234613 RepID=A0ABQ4C2W9_9ACTN|nr:bifunctional lysylphosphatidylglycerol synthetase/lysine--tRNA ligase LysX [Asanoa iriomotensis]GIF57126.1 lysylphosphatidylglycerol biosynthesis bifunctional protein LysX [Asanoa iriomotensis]